MRRCQHQWHMSGPWSSCKEMEKMALQSWKWILNLVKDENASCFMHRFNVVEHNIYSTSINSIVYIDELLWMRCCQAARPTHIIIQKLCLHENSYSMICVLTTYF